jgi:peroxiredoxin Q/BCP
VAYFGASTDSPEKNRSFAESLELDFPILSDPSKDVARAHGVLKMRLYAARHTVYIGADGRVLHVDTRVKAATAGEDMAVKLDELGVPRRDS